MIIPSKFLSKNKIFFVIFGTIKFWSKIKDEEELDK
jgi:hypothetical protein